MAFYLGPGGAGDATGDASSASVLATQKAAEAAASAASALASSSTATTAATTANTASSSASTSATNALNSATLAATSATTATTKAAEAVVSANAAAASAASVGSQAADAATSASNAATSATAAATSATSASNSATSATASATTAINAASSATASASSASADATTATTKAAEALASATSAATSATNAASSASSAASSASSASTSASTATTQATNASASATAAATSATVAVSASGAVLWVSGTTYAVGFVVYSPITFRTYRRKVAGAGTTDPSIDATNWGALLLDAETQLPTMRPSLLLDFSNTARLDPRVTFTRASTATRVNPNGLIETVASGSPRFDYDPITDACKGLLIEEQRTNLFTYSEQFDNAIWGVTSATVLANQIEAPDGTVTADKITEDVGTALLPRFSRTATIATSTQYSLSVFAKEVAGSSKRYLQIYANSGFSAGISQGANFDLSAGTVTLTTGFTAAIQAVKNGWFKCTLFTSISSATSSGIRIALVPAATTAMATNSNPDGTGSLYIWGAQLEAGAFATSYIPTVASQVTRAADVAVMTGTNFSSWYNQTEGTAHIEFVRFGTTGTPYPVGFSGGSTITSVPRITLRTDPLMNIQMQGVDASAVTQWNSSNFVGSPGFNAAARVGMAYANANIGGCVNGNTVTQISSGVVPTGIDKLFMGGSSGNLNGHIKRLTYYPKRLSNSELQALTS